MSNEQEYIELFDNNRALIEEPCAELLNKERAKAYTAFKAVGFPSAKSEQYRYTDVNPIFSENYGMNLGRLNVPVNPREIFSCDVPNLHTHQQYVVNDTYYPKAGEEVLPEGVILGSLNEIATKNPALLAPYYNMLAERGDGVTMFNTSFVQDGVVLFVSKNSCVEKTVQLMNVLRSNIDLLTNRRLLVVLEEGAQASMLVCDHAVEKIKSLSVQVIEVFVGRNARFELCELEETHGENVRLSQLFVKQEAGSSFNHTTITLTNGVTRNSAHVSLEGEGAEVNMYGLAISDKKQAGSNFKQEFIEKDYVDDEDIQIVRTKKFDIKPMYPEDACIQMELLGHNFFVFFNAETDQVNVVYKRKGNTYGIMEPDV